MLLPRLRTALQQVGDSIKAPAMQAYMKSAMPYHGVPTPLFREVCKATFADVQFTAASHWRDKRARPFQTPSAMKMYEELIVSGAWWDYVDDIASHRIGPILRDYPVPMRRKMLSWSKSNSLWKRRTAIICQLGFKAETDLELLYACIEPSVESREFFLQKAIGWALRQYAWTDGAEIKRYVRLKRVRLSALSCREALKNIG